MLKDKLKKTRNIMLLAAILMVNLYTIVNCLFGWINAKYGSVYQFDSALTNEYFEFWKWVVLSGGGITVAKVLKGKTNSDDDDTNNETGGVV